MNSHHMHTHPCAVPPSPLLLERLRNQRAGGTDTEVGLDILNHPRALGLNDGAIFPPSHFPPGTPSTVIANAAADRAALTGNIRVVIVLVDFPDRTMGAGVNERFTNLFFGTDRGTVSHFYADASRGAVTSFSGDVVGPFRMPNTLEYYANGQAGRGSQPNSTNLADDAYTAAISQIGSNLAQYDNDGNGYVDAFIVVHAGSGAEATGNNNDIWSVKWNLPEERIGPDGTRVFGFLTIPEDAQLGVCVHELGHLVFGWPDLYDTVAPGEGIGNWCVMSYGSWGGSPPGSNPVHPSAWCKMKQGWVEVVNETTDRTVDIPDVKDSGTIHRLWRNGDEGSEYFLLENRNLTGYDASLPGPGLQIWHIDESIPDNTGLNGLPYQVALMQADGLRQLEDSGFGDPADPFPGANNNQNFTFGTNPSSKTNSGADSGVSVTNITSNGSNITANVSVQARAFSAVFQSNGNGIGGYDILSPADRIFAFDFTHSGKTDSLAIYRPGQGNFAILRNDGGQSFSKVYDSTKGIGGFDFLNAADQAFAFDYDHSGKLDFIAIYRPGQGIFIILRHNGDGSFSKAYERPGQGIGGYDFLNSADRAFAFDYDHSGKLDHIACYRPGLGIFVIIKNNGGNFVKVYEMPGKGIGGYDFKNPSAVALAFDYQHTGKRDHIAVSVPGNGLFVIIKNENGVFSQVYNSSAGLAGFDFTNAQDRAIAFDYDHTGRLDSFVLYRSGQGSFVVATNNNNGSFSRSYEGPGISHLQDNALDDAIAFDYDHSGRMDYLVIYSPGAGNVLILKKT